MPYVDKEIRKKYDPMIDDVVKALDRESPRQFPGALNYIITRMIAESIPKPGYSEIAVITGVLENVKQEFYRRVASPYEDKKISLNGDVY